MSTYNLSEIFQFVNNKYIFYFQYLYFVQFHQNRTKSFRKCQPIPPRFLAPVSLSRFPFFYFCGVQTISRISSAEMIVASSFVILYQWHGSAKLCAFCVENSGLYPNISSCFRTFSRRQQKRSPFIKNLSIFCKTPSFYIFSAKRCCLPLKFPTVVRRFRSKNAPPPIPHSACRAVR